MKKYYKRHTIKYAIDRDFEHTIHQCRIKRENNKGTWITDEMEEAYCRLHDAGFALSFEAFVDGKLAGGLYGVNIGNCFFGESMYSEMENGFKAALIGLAHVLEDNGYVMIDCQFHTDHLERMGEIKISYEEYSKLLPTI